MRFGQYVGVRIYQAGCAQRERVQRPGNRYVCLDFPLQVVLEPDKIILVQIGEIHRHDVRMAVADIGDQRR